MAKSHSKWWEIGDESSRDAAVAFIKAQREKSPKECKFRIRVKRERSMFRSYGEYQTVERYKVERLCPWQG